MSNKQSIDRKMYTEYENRLKHLREVKDGSFANEFYKNKGDIKGT